VSRRSKKIPFCDTGRDKLESARIATSLQL
jgi:hypothetical protein